MIKNLRQLNLKPQLYFFIIWLTFFTYSCASQPTKNELCLERRGALDIGSATTKVQLAEVDICNKRLIRTLWAKDYKIEFKEDLQAQKNRSAPLTFSEKITEQAFQIFKEVIETAKQLNIPVSQVRAIATAAFRDANNSHEITYRAGQQLGLSIAVISQKQEAHLGLEATLVQTQEKPENIVVWDIGGGSMQIIYYDQALQKFEIYQGQLASVSFKNEFIQKIQKQKPQQKLTPNPISEKQSKLGLEQVRSYADQHLPVDLKKLIRTRAVYGTGGVLVLSLPNQIKPANSSITLSELLKTLKTQLNKHDSQIPSKYADTDVTNLILVAGYMQALGLDKYITAAPNNTLGLLVSPDFWN